MKLRYVKEKLITIFKSGGITLLLKKLKEYTIYNFVDKWQFVYFEADLNTAYKFPKNFDPEVKIIIANEMDIQKIEEDIFPYMPDIATSDKREILEIGKDGMICFLAKKNSKYIHYTLIYPNAFNSPLMDTPFDQLLLTSDHAYLSSAFTIDSERGSWVHLHALSYILGYLRRETSLKKTINLVHPNVLGSINYFNRLGFRQIKGPISPVYLKYLSRIIGYKEKEG